MVTEMHKLLGAVTVVSTILIGLSVKDGGAEGETPAQFLERYERETLPMKNMVAEAAWQQKTNITDENTAAFVKANLELAKFSQKMENQALVFLKDKSLQLTFDQRRQLNKIADIDTNAQTDKTKLERLQTVITEMEQIYSEAEVCMNPSGDCLKLEPGLTELMRSSRDCQKLSDAWRGWRDQSGKKMKDLYQEYVQLSNEAVQILGHKDLGDYWKSRYDTSTFEEDVAVLFDQLLPLYQHLHSYVRRKLKAQYGPEIFPSTGHIPAHLLGNMWSQQWNNIADLVNPFKNKQLMDVTEEMKRQGYTIKKMFETAEDFFYSLGFDNMTQIFWEKSMLERPEGREVVCHASAWDMDKQDDFRIKMCTTINHEDLMTVHHEMGHIQYYMLYENQPLVYRHGANPGFHEAVGDTIALSVQTPGHLKTIGLLKAGNEQDKEADINFLMLMALDKIAFLPFGYLIDQWRWSVFRGDTPPEQYNNEWWKLRCRLQGISPAVKRGADDFDPAAKYHIVADVPYIRYFVSFVLQFQFYKAACVAAGYTGPLYKCDFYNNKAAGEKFKSMLQLGSSLPWPEAMERMTGQRHMDAGPLVEYFEPLLDFLRKENGEDYGWEEKCPENPPPCQSGTGRLATPIWGVALLAVIGVTFGRLRLPVLV
ncbi:hypothetical protein RRG08_045043 [Elysia crispata]|uniref:Angiotensin-converting enzyme n=1 Tax=Elysia crispata TaxID=231223 RepID=A0AAE0XTL8_9GAST|nr:hypothetical protein RRG08_045043 [Elysia crispata]